MKKDGWIKINLQVIVPQRPIIIRRALNKGIKNIWYYRLKPLGLRHMPIECNTEEKLAEWLYRSGTGDGVYIGQGWQRVKGKMKFTSKLFEMQIWKANNKIDFDVNYIRGMYRYFNWKKRYTDEKVMKLEDQPLPVKYFGTEDIYEKEGVDHGSSDIV